MVDIVIVDMQGFVLESRFVPKELCILKNGQELHYLFKYPNDLSLVSYKDQKTARYLKNHHHGLLYSGGDVPYEECENILQKHLADVKRMYVCGHQKADFLREKFGTSKTITNLEDAKVAPPKAEKKRPSCLGHDLRLCVCSLTYAREIYKWLIKG